MASRTLPSRAVLVSVALDSKGAARAALANQREDMVAFSRLGLSLEDATVETVSERLARTLPATASADVEVLAAALRAGVGERSITAQRTLEAQLGTSATKAALVHDGPLDAVVMVAREGIDLAVMVQPTNAPAPSVVTRRTSVGACARAVAAGGLCRVEAVP